MDCFMQYPWPNLPENPGGVEYSDGHEGRGSVGVYSKSWSLSVPLSGLLPQQAQRRPPGRAAPLGWPPS